MGYNVIPYNEDLYLLDSKEYTRLFRSTLGWASPIAYYLKGLKWGDIMIKRKPSYKQLKSILDGVIFWSIIMLFIEMAWYILSGALFWSF